MLIKADAVACFISENTSLIRVEEVRVESAKRRPCGSLGCLF